LIVLVLVVSSLSGCLESEKKNETQGINGSLNVAQHIDLAFENLIRAGGFVDEAYVEEGRERL